MKVLQHLDLLGRNVTDKVTGLTGVVTSVSFDLYGCIVALVHPGLKDGKPQEQLWFDVGRLRVSPGEPVMDRPNYIDGRQAEGQQGAADKPPMNKS